VQTRIRGSYRSHYRRLLAPLLNTLAFRSNNERHRPVIEALALLKWKVFAKNTQKGASRNFMGFGLTPPVRNQHLIVLDVGAEVLKRFCKQ
jgi:hypothetical protein